MIAQKGGIIYGLSFQEKNNQKARRTPSPNHTGMHEKTCIMKKPTQKQYYLENSNSNFEKNIYTRNSSHESNLNYDVYAAKNDSSVSYITSPPIIQGMFDEKLSGKDANSIFSSIIELYTTNIVSRSFLKTFIDNALEDPQNTYHSIEDLVSAFNTKHRNYTLQPQNTSGSLPAIPSVQYGQGTSYSPKNLENAIASLYNQPQLPTRTNMLNTIVGLYTQTDIQNIVEQADFIADLQAYIRASISSRNVYQDFIRKTPITKIDDSMATSSSIAVPPKLEIDKFVLRHYTTGDTPPTFDTIRSTLSLSIDNINTSPGGHTNNIDWNTYGNIGNTFFILLVDNHFVCKQRFVDHCRYYTDIPLSTINRPIWFSSDWLDQNNITGQAYEGNAIQIHKQLISIVYNEFCMQQKSESPNIMESEIQSKFRDMNPDIFAETLGSLYHNFEVKVRGPVNRTSEWFPINPT